MSAYRTLPARPNIEFERKEAKALLRALQAGESDALARARERHAPFTNTPPDQFQLADAQLIQAREYGFTSWPKLVRYFEELERVRVGLHVVRSGGTTRADGLVRSLLAMHRDRRTWAGRALAAYVPRFYGLMHDEIFAAIVTEDDARLAFARSEGATSWEAWLAQPVIEDGPHPLASLLGSTIKDADLAGLQRIAAEHPKLLHPGTPPAPNDFRLLRSVLHHERRQGREKFRPMVEWLVAQGLDLQQELDLQLCGHRNRKTEKVRWLLERGANPDWVAPNGIPVLEHALILYYNGEAVDVLAAHTRPRQALWISAGLGDVDGVRRSLDARGKPTAAATELRPPFDAVGAHSLASHPEPDDEELLMEALFVAMTNGRAAIIGYLASRGAPLDSPVFGNTALSVAVGNGWAPVVEVMLKCGADLDIPTGDSNGTPREMGRSFFRPDDPARRRVAALCGWDPEKLLAERPTAG